MKNVILLAIFCSLSALAMETSIKNNTDTAVEVEAFFKAVKEGDLEKVKSLLNNKIPVNIQNKEGDTAILIALREVLQSDKHKNFDLVNTLISAQADIYIPNNNKETGYTIMLKKYGF